MMENIWYRNFYTYELYLRFIMQSISFFLFADTVM